MQRNQGRSGVSRKGAKSGIIGKIQFLIMQYIPTRKGGDTMEEEKKDAVQAAEEMGVEELPTEEVTEIPEENVETLPPTVCEGELPVEILEDDAEEGPAADCEVELQDDRDKEADSLIHWAAARAGAIVVLPFVGTLTLMANEVYMIVKIGKVYDVELVDKAAMSFIGALGGTVTGTLAATLIPIPLMQLPIAVGVTYGVGKAAKQWIKDGMPDDMRPYREVFETAKKEGEAQAEEIEKDPKKDTPLGDENADFGMKDRVYPEGAHAAFEKLTKNLTAAAGAAGETIADVLRAVGVKDEQIENAKYTILGAGDVAKEQGSRAAKAFHAKAKVKSAEWKETAKQTSANLGEEAKTKVEELRGKAEQLRYEADLRMAQAELAAEKAKAEARVRMSEAKVKAQIAKAEAAVRAEEAKVKAAAHAETMQGRARDLKENAAKAAASVADNFRGAVEDFKTKTMERADQRRREQRASLPAGAASAADDAASPAKADEVEPKAVETKE